MGGASNKMAVRIKSGSLGADTYKGGGHVETMTRPQARETPRSPAVARARKSPAQGLPHGLARNPPCGHLELGLWPPVWET